MSNLTKEMEAYIGTKSVSKPYTPEQLYALVDNKIEYAKTYLNKDNKKVLKQNLDDLRQDFVTTMFYLEKNKYFKQNRGSREDFNELVFEMVLGKYDVLFTQDFPAPLYPKPMKNFEAKFKTANYGEFVDFAAMTSLSPLAIAKYLKLPQKQLVDMLQLTNNQLENFKANDDYNLSNVKVKAPTKK